AIRESVLCAVENARDMFERTRHVGTEYLQVDRGAQTELGAGNGRRAAVAAVPDRRHTGRKALSGAEPGDVHVLLPADSGLPLDVQGDPLGEVTEPVSEAAVHRVLEVRVRVHEAGDDHRILVLDTRAKLFGRAHRGDPA